MERGSGGQRSKGHGGGPGADGGLRAPSATDLLARAIDRHRAGLLAEAAALYRQVLDADPGDADALFLAGSAAHGMGRDEEALELLALALGARPAFAAALNNLGVVLRGMGREAEAAERFRQAVDADAAFAPARRNLGDTLMAIGRRDEALAAYHAALALDPQAAETHNNLAMALRAVGDAAGAVRHLSRAVALAPDYALARYNLCTVLLESGRSREVPVLCGDSWLGARMSGGLLACRAVAAGETGDDAVASRLLDLDGLVRVEHLGVPPGYADRNAFNAALAAFVTCHPSLVWEPPNQSTRGGRVTRDLSRREKEGPFADLARMVEAAFVRYADDLRRRLPHHPLLACRPAASRLSAWGVAMGRAGHQAPHIHPAGWLSSVYYVALPPSVRGSGEAREGWIEFGRPPEAFGCRSSYPTRAVRPEEGLFVAFPSYVYHRTLPYAEDAPRISIAFDLEPAG